MENGVREELIPLVSLKGVGRIRARALFSAGFVSIDALKRASPAQLSAVPTIGPETVRAIKEQVGGKVTKEEWSMVRAKVAAVDGMVVREEAVPIETAPVRQVSL
jgi:replicative superfamily II helicase